MRNLTIKREKSFVGCLMSSKIYVQNDVLGDTKINGENCFMLGTLKNGEEKTFTIDDCETKIYVIQDKLSKNMCNEMCIIPAGVDDIYLMGENKYNPLGGNGFRFHGLTDPRVLANRKKSSKKFLIYIAICVVVGIVLGVWSSYDPPEYAKDGEPYEFANEAGITLTLTDTFEEMQSEGYDFTYGTNDAVVFGFKESFKDYADLKDYTVKEYGEEYIKYWEIDSKIQNKDGLTYFEYDAVGDDGVTKYCYMDVIYKTEDAFWVVIFAVDEPNYEEYKPTFVEWAKTVEFVED